MLCFHTGLKTHTEPDRSHRVTQKDESSSKNTPIQFKLLNTIFYIRALFRIKNITIETASLTTESSGVVKNALILY